MESTPEITSTSPLQAPRQAWTSARLLRWGLLAAVLLIAAGIRLWNMSALGLANHYYAAAVQSMLQNWHNFFFVAAEPGGSVSVDKPPLGLWIQTLSAMLFGVNSFGLLFPQILAGLLSVWLVYRLAARSFGYWPGLLAALALALTPIVVATDRNNTMDSLLILTLLLAAWAFLKATETRRLRWLLLGGVLVGLGFNIKMLEAFLPLPAFLALYFLGAKERLLPKLGKLALTGLVLAVVSFSWITIVDLTPAAQRPYVGSSGDNSEWSLALGYNGVNRLLGMAGRGGQQRSLTQLFGNNSRGNPQGNFPQGNLQRGSPGGQGGFPGTGQAGPLRVLIPPLSKEMSWMLPFGLFALLLLLFAARPSWPLAVTHQAIVLWGGWLLTGLVFFSVAGFFHEYYLSILGAPLAVLIGAGAGRLDALRQRRPWLAVGLLILVGAFTLLYQGYTAQYYVGSFGWTFLAMILFGFGTLASLWGSLSRGRSSAVIASGAAALMLASLLVIPGVWSVLSAQNFSSNQSLPAAYGGSGQGFAQGGAFRQGGRPDGGLTAPQNQAGSPLGQVPAGAQSSGTQSNRTQSNRTDGTVSINQQLLSFLQANTSGMRYLMAVPSSMQGADYVLASGRPVLYMGGFNGQDQVLTLDQLKALVDSGQLRYIYFGNEGRMGGPAGVRGGSEISTWVQNTCQAVGFNTQTQNQGAPDGSSGGSGGFPFGNSFNLTLYDCQP